MVLTELQLGKSAVSMSYALQMRRKIALGRIRTRRLDACIDSCLVSLLFQSVLLPAPESERCLLVCKQESTTQTQKGRKTQSTSDSTLGSRWIEHLHQVDGGREGSRSSSHDCVVRGTEGTHYTGEMRVRIDDGIRRIESFDGCALSMVSQSSRARAGWGW